MTCNVCLCRAGVYLHFDGDVGGGSTGFWIGGSTGFWILLTSYMNHVYQHPAT